MLRAEPANRHVNKRYVEKSKYGEHCGQYRCLTARRVLAQDQVAHVNQPEDKGARKSRVPRPPDAPDWSSPKRPGNENDGAEDNADLGTSDRNCVRPPATTNEEPDGC